MSTDVSTEPQGVDAARAVLRAAHQGPFSGKAILGRLFPEIEEALARGCARQWVYEQIVAHTQYRGTFLSFQSTLQRLRREARGEPAPDRAQAFRWELVGRYVWEQIAQGQLDWDLDALMDDYLDDPQERQRWQDGGS